MGENLWWEGLRLEFGLEENGVMDGESGDNGRGKRTGWAKKVSP